MDEMDENEAELTVIKEKLEKKNMRRMMMKEIKMMLEDKSSDE